MASDHKALEVMNCQAGQEEGEEEGDELSRSSAPSMVTTVIHLDRGHSADRTPRFPIGLGFLVKYGKAPRQGRQTPEPTSESLITVWIRRLEQIFCRFEPKLTVS